MPTISTPLSVTLDSLSCSGIQTDEIKFAATVAPSSPHGSEAKNYCSAGKSLSKASLSLFPNADE